jgi:transposase-like protein
VEGSTENATLVTEVLVDLRERGLDVTRPMLVGLDGSNALRKAVLDVLDHPVIQRCQLHYADVRIMPMPLVNPLQGNAFLLNRSA